MLLRTLDMLPRVRLAHLPTPVEELKRLSAFLGGPRLLIKRDDLTGLALGGNKTRKLEFLMANAHAEQADTIITAGAAQSNHCRQTAAAAAKVGLRCELVLGGEPKEVPNGNLLLNMLCGARIHWTGMDRRGERMDEVADELRSKGRVPYLIPYGGSNAVGATGYVTAMLELMDQLSSLGSRVDHIVFASSSGGTQAGVVVGAKAAGFSGAVHGISIDKGGRTGDAFDVELAQLANQTASHLGMSERFAPNNFTLNYNYIGGGYGVVGDREREAIGLMARYEGILLDPVYTGRAFGALIDMIRMRMIGAEETVLFWHTGGAPALFAYAGQLL